MKDLFNLVFHAFIFWTFIWVFTRRGTPAAFRMDKIDRVVTRVAIVMGVIVMFVFLARFFDEGGKASMREMALGEYWFGFWINPFTYIVLVQPLWVESIRKNKVVRIMIALWMLLLLHVEVIIILITSFHRDHVPQTW